MPPVDPYERLLEDLPQNEAVARHLLAIRTPSEYRRAHGLEPTPPSHQPESHTLHQQSEQEALREELDSDSEDNDSDPDEADDEELDDAPILSGSRKISMSRITFTGKNPRKLEEFFIIAEADFRQDDAFRESEDKRSAYVISRLRDTAFKWYVQEKKTHPGIEFSYTALKVALQQRFGVSDTEKRVKAQTTLGAIQQKGTVQAYSTYFDSLVADAGWQAQENLKELYLNGLYPSLQRAIRANPDFDEETDMEWIRRAAQNAQEAFNSSRPYGSPSTPRTPRTTDRDGCFRCGQKGHWANECASYGRSPAARRGRGGSSQPTGSFVPGTRFTTPAPSQSQAW